MSFFETIIRDLNKRFGLGVHAGALVMEALRTITSRQSGGLPGFLDRFRSAGLGDLVGSWIGTGENTAIEPTQVESALGSDFISRMAAKVGLSPSVTTPALAYLIPKVVNHMTPDGTMPSHLPADVSTFLAGDMPTTSAAAAAPGTAAAAHAAADPAYTGATARAPASAEASSRRGGILRKLIPLLGLLLLGLVAYWFFGRGGEQTAERAPTPTAPSVQAPAAGGQGEVAAAPSQLALRNADGQILYTGSVPNQQTSTGILDALKAVFGSAIAGNLSIDPNATAPDWLGKLSGALAAFNIPGADMLLKGNEVGIGGAISDAQKSDLIGRLKSVFGDGMSVGALSQSLADMFAGIATPTVAPTPTAPSVEAPAAGGQGEVAAAPSQLALRNADGQILYTGSVPNQQTSTGILDALKAVFGSAIAGNLSIDPNATAPDWLGKLSDALAAFNIPGADMLLKGNEVGIGGAISDAQKSDLIGRLKSVFGEGMSVGALSQSLADMFAGIATPTVATAAPASPTAGDPAAAAKAANDKSLVALQSLPSGYSASQLVDVLNASVINFETGSAVIPADSQTFLQSVAGTMSKAPAGTHIEIGGHTDSTGDPEKNLALSQARADAVRQALIDHGVAPEMLSAKGYGGTQPIASNDTAQGRERNRRIAFSVR